eukprot:GHVH01004403.1.p1 GENE.GHVH01004403.1~~GHVH01004403.1.p1  ORF type:complete len:312 (+),score=34.11 GHVH01004403.1:45-938(+)
MGRSFHTLMMLIDSTFPTGSFHYSGGVEAALRTGLIGAKDDLSDVPVERLYHLVSQMSVNSLTSLGPYVCASYQITKHCQDNERYLRLNLLYINKLARCSMGVNTVATLIPSETLASNLIRTIKESHFDELLYQRVVCLSRPSQPPRKDGIQPNEGWVLPVIWGFIGAVLGWGLKATLQAFMVTGTRARLMAGVRDGTHLTVMPSIYMLARMYDDDSTIDKMMNELVVDLESCFDAFVKSVGILDDQTALAGTSLNPPLGFLDAYFEILKQKVYTCQFVPDVVSGMHQDLHSRLFRG